MKGSQSVSPLHFGRGTQKVSLYSPTTALPYNRLVYRLGGKRIQRTFKDLNKAKSEAKAIAEKLSKGEVSVAQITAREALQLRSAQDHLTLSAGRAGFFMRLLGCGSSAGILFWRLI